MQEMIDDYIKQLIQLGYSKQQALIIAGQHLSNGTLDQLAAEISESEVVCYG